MDASWCGAARASDGASCVCVVQVVLHDVRYPIFLALLEYLYTDEVAIDLDIAMELFQVMTHCCITKYTNGGAVDDADAWGWLLVLGGTGSRPVRCGAVEEDVRVQDAGLDLHRERGLHLSRR